MKVQAAKSVSGVVVALSRLSNTQSGNPRHDVTLRLTALDGVPVDYCTSPDSIIVTLRISDDAGLAYEIENPEFRETPHTFALARAGRISHVIRATGANRCSVYLMPGMRCELDGAHAGPHVPQQ